MEVLFGSLWASSQFFINLREEKPPLKVEMFTPDPKRNIENVDSWALVCRSEQEPYLSYFCRGLWKARWSSRKIERYIELNHHSTPISSVSYWLPSCIIGQIALKSTFTPAVGMLISKGADGISTVCVDIPIFFFEFWAAMLLLLLRSIWATSTLVWHYNYGEIQQKTKF